MGKYIYNENNGLWYELQGEYYLPCLTFYKRYAADCRDFKNLGSPF